MTSAVYFLIKYHENNSYVAYGSGVSVMNIPEFHTCRIMRFYPSPQCDITPRLITLQRHWRRWLKWRRWFLHPRRIQERAMYGRWAQNAPKQLNVLNLNQ